MLEPLELKQLTRVQFKMEGLGCEEQPGANAPPSGGWGEVPNGRERRKLIKPHRV